MLSASVILIKGSNIPNKVPAISSLEPRELALNTADGAIFLKNSQNELLIFEDKSKSAYTFDRTLSSINVNFGSNNVTEVFGAILNGFNNDVSGAGSTVVNGEDNNISGDFCFIGNGLNNDIGASGDYSAIVGGQNNNLNHPNSFIVGSNITSHAENFTYVNNLSVVGKIYGDGSELIGTTGNGTLTNELSNYATLEFVNFGFLPLSGETSMVSLSVQQLSANKIAINANSNSPTVLYVASEGKVGINTEYPNSALSVNGSVEIAGITTTNSDVEITDSTKGIILRSPNNNRWRITVTNSGTLSVAAL